MMPMEMRRKTCGMEKVEKVYRTARAQNDVPRQCDQTREA